MGALLPIFIVGVTLTVTRAITKSVATCVLIHMTYNFLLMANLYGHTWIPRYAGNLEYSRELIQ